MIHFACPRCGRDFELPDSVAGFSAGCTACGQAFQVPATAAPHVTAPSPMSDTAKIRFSCPSCKFDLSAPVSKAGAKSRCPKCKQAVEVPQQAALSTTVPPQVPRYVPVEVLVPEVLTVPEALPVGPPRDPSEKYYLIDCPTCGRPLRVPTYERGRILRCPSCRYFYKAPGRLRHRDDDDGLPVSVRVSAHILVWPQCCACCLDYHDAEATAAHTRVDWAGIACAIDSFRRGWYGHSALWTESSVQQKSWEIPYCWECLDHIEKRTDCCKQTCCNLGPAVIYGG
jgi:DNA-directed RNA polymerase subunit M/transcription elongation factor TFIIS